MSFRVNLDFDQALQKNNPRYENPRINKAFEYIFILLNESEENELYNYNDYEESYLTYLSAKGFVIPRFNKGGKYSNWWGNTDEFELGRKLNSKIETSLFAHNNDLCPSGLTIINNEAELVSATDSDESTRFYYRSEYGFSGMGNKVIEVNKKYSLRYPGTLVNYLNKELSFGITVDLKTMKYFICENTIDDRGTFCGGRIIDETFLASLLGITREKFIEELLVVFEKIRRQYGPLKIQFDSMIYKEESINKWYKLVEINYRRTMAEVIYQLHSKQGRGKWVIEKNIYTDKSISELETILEKQSKKNIVVTSPSDTPLLSYYQTEK